MAPPLMLMMVITAPPPPPPLISEWQSAFSWPQSQRSARSQIGAHVCLELERHAGRKSTARERQVSLRKPIGSGGQLLALYLSLLQSSRAARFWWRLLRASRAEAEGVALGDVRRPSGSWGPSAVEQAHESALAPQPGKLVDDAEQRAEQHREADVA